MEHFWKLKKAPSFLIVIGLLLILLFLFLIYFGVVKDSQFGLIGLRKNQQISEAAGRKTAPTLVVSPNNPLINQPFAVTGSGFKRNEQIYVGLQGFFGLVPITADSQGTFVYPYAGISTPGNYTFVAMRYARKNWTVGASIPFTVVAN